MPEMPNHKALSVGRAEDVPIPEWAVTNFAAPRKGVLNPLDMAAGSRMVALNTRRVLGIPTMPWSKDKVARAGYRAAQGAMVVYNPVGYGQRYS